MPQLVAAKIVGYLALTGVTATIATYAITAGIYFLAGRFLYGQLRPPNPNIPSRPLSTRKQYLNEPNAPQDIIYGEATIAPAIIADFSDDKKLNILGAMAPHPLEDEIVEIRVNEQAFFTAAEMETLNTTGRVIILGSGEGKSGISELRDQINDRAVAANLPIMRLHRDFTATPSRQKPPGEADRDGDVVAGTFSSIASGGASTLWPPLFGEGAGRQPANLSMKMSGLSWVYMAFPRDTQELRDANKLPVWNQVPTLTFRVRRANSSLRLPAGFDGSAYTRGNTALCAYDYLARYTDYANEVCDIARIDEASFRAAALFCEQEALTANGAVSLATPPSEVMDQLGLAMNSGVFPEYGGVRYFAAGAPTPATLTITDDIIVKDSWAYSLLTPVESRVSQLICRYADRDGVEQGEGAHYNTRATTQSQELQLDLVNDAEQAAQVARILLTRIWSGATLSLEVVDTRLGMDFDNDDYEGIKPYDKVRVTGCGALNIDDEFRILSVERTAEGRLGLQLQFEHPNLFDQQPTGEDYIPPSRLPNYGPVATDETFRITLNGTGNRLLVRGAGATEASFLSYR